MYDSLQGKPITYGSLYGSPKSYLPEPELCPICSASMKVYRDTQDGGVLLEDSQDCPTGHYSYMYAYGNTQIDIGGYTFEHHWQDEDWREFWQNVTNCTQLLKKGFQNARQND